MQFTNKSTSYVDISKYVELHVTEKSSKQTTKETLRWVHITISNAKRNLLGNYHKIKGKYLQLYLNEFVYKLNRRYFEDKLHTIPKSVSELKKGFPTINFIIVNNYKHYYPRIVISPNF